MEQTQKSHFSLRDFEEGRIVHQGVLGSGGYGSVHKVFVTFTSIS